MSNKIRLTIERAPRERRIIATCSPADTRQKCSDIQFGKMTVLSLGASFSAEVRSTVTMLRVEHRDTVEAWHGTRSREREPEFNEDPGAYTMPAPIRTHTDTNKHAYAQRHGRVIAEKGTARQKQRQQTHHRYTICNYRVSFPRVDHARLSSLSRPVRDRVRNCGKRRRLEQKSLAGPLRVPAASS